MIRERRTSHQTEHVSSSRQEGRVWSVYPRGGNGELTVCGLPAIRAISEKVIPWDEVVRAKGEWVTSTA